MRAEYVQNAYRIRAEYMQNAFIMRAEHVQNAVKAVVLSCSSSNVNGVDSGDHRGDCGHRRAQQQQ